MHFHLMIFHRQVQRAELIKFGVRVKYVLNAEKLMCLFLCNCVQLTVVDAKAYRPVFLLD